MEKPEPPVRKSFFAGDSVEIRVTKGISLRKGDLLFWGMPVNNATDARNVSFTDAVTASSGNGLQIFHVSLLLSPKYMVHATSISGVVQEEVSVYSKRLLKDRPLYEVVAMAVTNFPDHVKDIAADYCLNQLGASYNDVFSERCVDSRGTKAFYCCQLVRKAYEYAAGRPVFPVQQLNFNDTTGTLLPYWVDYFAQRNRMVPVDEYGSHPARLLKSDRLTQAMWCTLRSGAIGQFANALSSNFVV
ncbi:unnamed protein product [Soboliphyme baturini]|uniref:Permuted papain-like amidase enzyme, YaeF/YiiX, C92 family n=1 Tax=Soboliphyme baturini TaxID=241478 RepID=A0A183J264_9BILA|nr:unnamed protein product [Soboliphyme baturini]